MKWKKVTIGYFNPPEVIDYTKFTHTLKCWPCWPGFCECRCPHDVRMNFPCDTCGRLDPELEDCNDPRTI